MPDGGFHYLSTSTIEGKKTSGGDQDPRQWERGREGGRRQGEREGLQVRKTNKDEGGRLPKGD